MHILSVKELGIKNINRGYTRKNLKRALFLFSSQPPSNLATAKQQQSRLASKFEFVADGHRMHRLLR